MITALAICVSCEPKPDAEAPAPAPAAVAPEVRPDRAPPVPASAPPPGFDEAFAVRLRFMQQAAEAGTEPFGSLARAEFLAAAGAPATGGPEAEVGWRRELAAAWLEAGREEAAIDVLEAASPEAGARLAVDRGVAFLRLAERVNCVGHHSAESCLFPLRGRARHVEADPANRAIDELQAVLAARPDDLDSAWLLNVAAMAADRWPDAVPAPHRLPAEVAAPPERDDVVRFADRATELGVTAHAPMGGTVADDLDGDGDVDLLFSSWAGAGRLWLYRQRADGTFEDATAAAGLDGVRGALNLVPADYDGDGDVDVYVPRGAWQRDPPFPAHALLRNDGGGRFEDVAGAVGLHASAPGPSQTAAWADVDGDGRLDLFVGAESNDRDYHASRLYKQRADGTFADVTEEMGTIPFGYVKAVLFGDVDDDGRPDLFLSRLGQPNLLLRNLDGTRFEDVTAGAGVAEPIVSFPATFLDYDSDGVLDLFVSGYTERFFDSGAREVVAEWFGERSAGARAKLYRGVGGGRFEDVSAVTGLDRVVYTMGFNAGDLDGDGWTDLYLGTGAPDFRALMPNVALRNPGAGGGPFEDVTVAAGLGHLQKGHGVAFADLDGDGDDDVVANLGGAFAGDGFVNALFFRPGAPDPSRWIAFDLGAASPGARVAVVTDRRTVHRLAGTGGSFGANDPVVRVGLGDGETVERVEIRWPGGGTETIEGPTSGRVHAVARR